MGRAPRIDGPIVTLRAPEEADAEAWLRAGRDPEIVLGYGARVERRPFTAGEAADQVHALQARPWGWVIESRGEVVGHVALHEYDADRRDAFVALGLLHSALLDQGLGTAALSAVLAWAAGPPLALCTIHLRVAEYNARAIECYRKCGFVQVGREERAFELDGEWIADLVMQRTLPEPAV